MDVFVRDEIDCALLFDHVYPALDIAAVLGFLTGSFPQLGFELGVAGQDESYLLITGHGPIFVAVSQNRRPLAAESFRYALHSPFQQILSPRIDEAVAAHMSNVFITVSHKQPVADLVNPELKVSLQPAPLVEQKIMICQRLAAFISAGYEACALHWRQSNLLFTPECFRTLAAFQEFPSPLHLHPELFSRGESHGGRRTIGFTTFGARHVIGREILFNESPADVKWMLQKALAFLHLARFRDYSLLPDGESFGASPGEVIRVRHRPPNQDNVSIIELTVEKSAEQGIAAEPPPPPPPPPAAPPQPAPPLSGAPVFGRRKTL